MILAMVGNLAARLEQQPDDVEGWARLGRSYMVLNEPQKARDAYAHALKLKPDDAALKEWTAFMNAYYPEGDKTTSFAVYGYLTAQTLVQVLKQCGDELTRENVMKQAKNLKDFELDMLVPGIRINTGPDDYFPIEEMQMSRFNGEYSEQFGPILSGR